MIALAITDIHPSVNEWFHHFGPNGEWIELTNIGTTGIDVHGFYLKTKSAYGNRGFEHVIYVKGGSWLLESGKKLRIMAGYRDDDSPPVKEGARYFMNQEHYFLNEVADLISIYQSRQDCEEGRQPLVQVNYYGGQQFTFDEPDGDIPF